MVFFIIFIFFSVLLSLLVGMIGSNRNIGFFASFFISILLSPLIGIIFVLFSKRLSDIEFEKNLLNNTKQQKVTIEGLSDSQTNSSSIVADLHKLSELLERGIITREDFEKIKINLLTNVNTNTTNSTNSEVDDEHLPLIIYSTSQGDIYVRQNGNQPSVGDKVFTYYKKPHYDVVVKIKNGWRLKISSGKISEIF